MDVDLAAPKKKAESKLDPRDVPTTSVSSEAKGTVGLHKETASRLKTVGKTEEKQDMQQGDKGKKRASQPPLRDEAPKPKKARIAGSSEASGSRPQTQSRTKRVEAKSSRKTETRDVQSKGKKGARADARPPAPKRRPRKARRRSPSLSASSSRSSSVSLEEATLPSPELDPELCGMLIECMATSRASSLPMSTLYRTVMQSYPSLKSRGTEHECLEIMERVLEGGTVAGGGSGVFGKVQRNGKVRTMFCLTPTRFR
jgi:hypothetical protein